MWKCLQPARLCRGEMQTAQERVHMNAVYFLRLNQSVCHESQVDI